MKKYLFFIIFALMFSQSVFAETANTGFIPEQIWYSQDTFQEGDSVKIFTAVWNGDSNSLSARVEFYDKNVILGYRDIVVSPQSLKDVSVPWKVTAGDHLISVKIVSSKIMVNGKSESVVLENREAKDNQIFVSKLIKQADGTPISSTDIVKDQVSKTGSEILDILPESTSKNVSGALASVDVFRAKTYTDITSNLSEIKKKIDTFKEEPTIAENSDDVSKKSDTAVKSVSGVDKPIAYLGLIFFSIAGFIFKSSVVFYIVGIIVVFIVLRFLYRKIRNR